MARKAIPEENFLTSGIFTFRSYSCKCEEVAVTSNISALPVPGIKCTPDVNCKINFAFGAKVGLVRLNSDGSVAETNILGKLASMKGDGISDYSAFFERNGFLFPIDRPEIIVISDIQFLVDRLRATLELISTITDMSRTSYEKIVRLSFYHLFAPVVTMETQEGKYKYFSDRHRYSTFLESRKNAQREARLNDTFNNSAFTFKDSVGVFSLDADFVDSVLNGTTVEGKYMNPLFHDVFNAYCTPRDNTPKDMLLINDFVFHYLYEVGMIDYVDLENTHYMDGTYHRECFSDQLKSASVDVAKYIIKEEIESNLRRVRPTYDIVKLEPAWKIDSLLSGLYFGLFYMRPNMEIYRRCANPRCGEFFLVPVSSRKKKYCCHACMNRAMAARKRAKDKIDATREKNSDEE